MSEEPDTELVVLAEFIRQIREKAWAEGFRDGKRQDFEGDDGPRFTNPYKEET